MVWRILRIREKTLQRLDLLGQDQTRGDIFIRHSIRKRWESWVSFQSKRGETHCGSREPRNSEPTEAAHYITREGMNRTRCNGFVVVAFQELSAQYTGTTCIH